MGKRRKARQMALQMLYQQEMGETAAHQVVDHFDLTETIAELHRRKGNYAAGKKEAEEAFAYGSALFSGTLDQKDRIDALIRKQADNWRLERMPAVDRNILRLAVYEMVFQRETPRLVVVDEAIELAKRFGSEQSGRFINGLLDGLLKNADDGKAAEPSVADPALDRK